MNHETRKHSDSFSRGPKRHRRSDREELKRARVRARRGRTVVVKVEEGGSATISLPSQEERGRPGKAPRRRPEAPQAKGCECSCDCKH